VWGDLLEAVRGSDALVYHPWTLGAYDVAEKLRIPAIQVAYIPQFTPTRQFPDPLVSGLGLCGATNWATHVAVRLAFYQMFADLRNRWRVRTLGLAPRPWYATDRKRHGRPVPMLYAYSPHVLPLPADWSGPLAVTGYWFLDGEGGWRPPAELETFLAAGPPPVYVGFGSMISADPERVTETVTEALRRCGRRGVLAAGWGGLARPAHSETVFHLDEVPHGWLFPWVAAVVHHGGAGTTAAGLRAGKPTVVCPYAFDQPFWGRVVHHLGVGPRPVPQSKLTAERLAAAIGEAVSDGAMRRRAEELGGKIRGEDGVARAVERISDLLAAGRAA
jgi:sterol 3beta-glucosyltransferase